MKRKVLLVEDNDDVRILLKHLMKSYGYSVTEVKDGLEAVETLQAQTHDLVLMDIGLPRMDGLTATKTIRTFKAGADIPIIAVTVHGREIYREAIAAGCNELVTKPIDFDSFEALLKKYLEE